MATDGLTGFSDAIEAVWPQAIVQTRVVHLIRNSMRFTAHTDRRPVVRALKPIYTAPTVDAAAQALDEFQTNWGSRYAAIVELWRRKVTTTRGSFPTDDAVLKIFYLAITNIGNHRRGDLGTHTQGWKQALNAFAIAFPGRIPDTLS